MGAVDEQVLRCALMEIVTEPDFACFVSICRCTSHPRRKRRTQYSTLVTSGTGWQGEETNFALLSGTGWQGEVAELLIHACNVKADMHLYTGWWCFGRALGVPVTDHTYEDCRLMRYATELNMPQASVLVEFQKLNKKLGYAHLTSSLFSTVRICRLASRVPPIVRLCRLASHIVLSTMRLHVCRSAPRVVWME